MSVDEEKKQSILLVEDDRLTRSAMVAVLELLGYDNVVDTGSGAHAIKLLDRDPGGFPIAIIDIFLSDMTAKHLAGNHESSGYLAGGAVYNAFKTGCGNYVLDGRDAHVAVAQQWRARLRGIKGNRPVRLCRCGDNAVRWIYRYR